MSLWRNFFSLPPHTGWIWGQLRHLVEARSGRGALSSLKWPSRQSPQSNESQRIFTHRSIGRSVMLPSNEYQDRIAKLTTLISISCIHPYGFMALYLGTGKILHLVLQDIAFVALCASEFHIFSLACTTALLQYVRTVFSKHTWKEWQTTHM